MQHTFYDYSALEILKGEKAILVCDDAFDLFDIEFPYEYVRFSDFTSNPHYEDLEAGVRLFREEKFDFIVAIGGGSCIDAAKCIKYYNESDAPFLAIPTTAGTGSETTHFAALYKDGEKYSIADEKLIPDYVILQPAVLETLPWYYRKCTMLDALCQAIESWWSRKATPVSIEYSRKAIRLIIDNMDAYLENEAEGNKCMLTAANLAGKAINITTTTGPHAMSYQLTSLFDLAHGHAVAICLPKVWRYMGNFDDIAISLGQKNSMEAVSFLEKLLKTLEISPPDNANDSDLDILVNTVNTERLDNNPVSLDKEAIRVLYKEILRMQ